MHILMLKEHKISGLKYLCKTSCRDPYKYNGSGILWKKHLKKYGTSIKTTILKECKTKDELIKEGIYYSKLWNVVEDQNFANLVEERGDGGPTMLGKKLSKESCDKKSKSLCKFYENASSEYMEIRREMNSKFHEKYRYYTPAGTFTNAYKAATANNCSNVTIINRCVKDMKKPIQSKKYWKYGWRGKTWESIGWYSEILNSQR